MYVTWGGTIRTRLGNIVVGTTTAVTVCPERLWIYETLDATPNVWAVGSFKNGSVYELRAAAMAPAAGAWTLVTALRGCNLSRWPHEGHVRRGKLYIKAFPADGDDAEKLGAIVLDGSGGTLATRPWGALGPSVAAALTPPGNLVISAATNANPVEFTTAASHGYATGKILTLSGATGSWTPVNSTFTITVTAVNKFTIPVNSTGFGALAGSPIVGWQTSAHAVAVGYGWLYSYTWVLQSGHETNRAPLQTNPDLAPSASGAFSNKIPTLVVVGNSDTTRYPFLNIYRTTDGGGTFYLLKKVANTGGSIIFNDTNLASGSAGATLLDPLPDTSINQQQIAPSENSNSPPPTVTPPQVTGTDTIKRCTKISEYAGRLFYGIDEYLYFSAQEELRGGVPEEAFPSGIASPNFFRFDKAVIYPEPTPNGLLVVIRNATLRISGTTKASFNPRPFLAGVGGAFGQRRGSTGVGDSVAWITQDYRLAVVNGDNYAILSGPLGRQIKVLADAGADLQPVFWTQGDKEWLILSAHNVADPTQSRQLIYDLRYARELKKDFWFPPWSIKSVVCAAGQKAATDTENMCFFGLWNGVNFQLCKLDEAATLASDPTPGDPTTLVGFTASFTPALHSVPYGDHVNQRRGANMSTTWASYTIERTNFTGSSEPLVEGFLDDLLTDPVNLGLGDPPPGRDQSKGYTTLVYNNIWKNCKRGTVRVTTSADKVVYEFHQVGWNWLPESGV